MWISSKALLLHCWQYKNMLLTLTEVRIVWIEIYYIAWHIFISCRDRWRCTIFPSLCALIYFKTSPLALEIFYLRLTTSQGGVAAPPRHYSSHTYLETLHTITSLKKKTEINLYKVACKYSKTYLYGISSFTCNVYDYKVYLQSTLHDSLHRMSYQLKLIFCCPIEIVWKGFFCNQSGMSPYIGCHVTLLWILFCFFGWK